MSHDQMLRALAECWNTVPYHTGVKVAPGIMEWLSSSPEEREYWVCECDFPENGNDPFDWTVICTSADDALRHATSSGYPVTVGPYQTTLANELRECADAGRLGLSVEIYDEQEGWVVLAEYPV